MLPNSRSTRAMIHSPPARLHAALSLILLVGFSACKHETKPAPAESTNPSAARSHPQPAGAALASSNPNPEAPPAPSASPTPEESVKPTATTFTCDGPVGQSRSYLVPSWQKSTQQLTTRPEQETVIERAMIGDYCVERLEVSSKGRPTAHVLRATDGKHTWRLNQLRLPLGQTTAVALESAIDELRPTDMLFTLGRTWTYTYARALHMSLEPFSGHAPKSVRVEVAQVAAVGDTEYAFLRHHTDEPWNWLWARRGTKLWFINYIEEPDLSFTSKPGSYYWWLKFLDVPAHIDTRSVRTELACTATVCLPAWHYWSEDYDFDFDLVPFVGTLRVFDRSSGEDNVLNDGTLHFFLRGVAPQASGETAPNLLSPRAESEALRDTRRRVVQALEAPAEKSANTAAQRTPTPLDALRPFTSKNFHITPFDKRFANWTDINQVWGAPHWACMKHMLLDILKEPCWELMPDVAICTEPHLEKDSLTPSALLATRASATFRREAGTWRLLNYLDPLALYEEGNLPACPKKD